MSQLLAAPLKDITEDVLFIDASSDYADGAGTQNQLRAQDIERIVETYRAYASVEKYAARATRAELAENDFNLNIPRYVDTFEPEAPVDLGAVREEIAALDEQLAATRREIDEHLDALGLMETNAE